MPRIHQNLQQQKFHNFSKRRSRCRGVAKVENRIPMLHGSRFFFDSHARWGCDFLLLRHLPSENAIFHFFDTSPAGSSKIMRMLFWNHLVGVTSPKTRSANRYQNHLYRARTFYLLIFEFTFGDIFYDQRRFMRFFT